MKKVLIRITVKDMMDGWEADGSEFYDLTDLIGTSQEAQDGCDPCEFGSELLGLIITTAQELS